MMNLPNRASDAGPESRGSIVYDHIYDAQEWLKSLAGYRDDDLATERHKRIRMAEQVKAEMDSIIELLGGK